MRLWILYFKKGWVREEGGYTLDSYRETFQKIYGFWNDNRIVWTVKFEIIDKRELIYT